MRLNQERSLMTVLALSRLSHRVITWKAGTVQDF